MPAKGVSRPRLVFALEQFPSPCIQPDLRTGFAAAIQPIQIPKKQQKTPIAWCDGGLDEEFCD